MGATFQRIKKKQSASPVQTGNALCKPVKMFCWGKLFLFLLYIEHVLNLLISLSSCYLQSLNRLFPFQARNSCINFCWSSGTLAYIEISPCICQVLIIWRSVLGCLFFFLPILLCSVLELWTSVTGTCSPAGNVLMTSVLLLGCSVIVNSCLIWVENPKALQSVCICKSDPQWQSRGFWGQLLLSREGSWYTLCTEEISLRWKLKKCLQICYLYIRNIKQLMRWKHCFPQGKKNPLLL